MLDLDLPSDVNKVSAESIGGGRIWSSGVYTAVIKLAYFDQAKSGAISFNIVLEDKDGRELKEAIYVRSGDAKDNKTYYEKDGKKYPLPGYITADSMCVAATGKRLPEVSESAEKKTINIYSFDQKKEVPTERPVIMDLLNKKVLVAVHEIVEDKRTQNSAGVYEPTGETRSKNECKFFGNAESGKSADEILDNSDATIFAKWAEKNTDRVINKSSKKDGATTPTGTEVNTTASSLFS